MESTRSVHRTLRLIGHTDLIAARDDRENQVHWESHESWPGVMAMSTPTVKRYGIILRKKDGTVVKPEAWSRNPRESTPPNRYAPAIARNGF